METMLNDHSARDHAMLGPSSAGRWQICTRSAVAAELYPSETSDFAAEGTLAHEVAEQVARAMLENRPRGIKPDAEKGITAEMIECAEAYADFISEKRESPDAVVLLEVRVDFSPWVPGGFGTCDCLILQGTKLTVIDYKYGAGVKVKASGGDGRGNPQMSLYALGAYNMYGFVYDVEEVEEIIFQPRMDNVSEYTETADALLAWGTEIKPIAEKAAKGEGEYVPGSHCQFCPHAGRCRALAELCFETAKNLTGEDVKVECLAPHEIQHLLDIEPLLSLAIKRIKGYAMDTMMGGGEIPGYKLVEGKLGNRKYINELEALKTFEAAGYQREDITEVKLLSPAQMEKALGKKKIADLMEQLTHRASGTPTIAKAEDKRPAYNRLEEAVKDFD